ncbi:MAG: hypothetical protein HEEMFOPI_00387 [Holosporales bacterium]
MIRFLSILLFLLIPVYDFSENHNAYPINRTINDPVKIFGDENDDDDDEEEEIIIDSNEEDLKSDKPS